jgi:hypothetical protein
MGISINCPCGQQTRVKNRFAGKTVLCPACNNPIPVPGVSETPDPALAEDSQTTEVGEALSEAGGPQRGDIQNHEKPSTVGAKKELTAKSAGPRKYVLLGMVAMLAFALGWITGHFGPSSARNLGANNWSGPSPGGNKQSRATITADPNPVPAGPGKGTTTISWDTGDGSLGQVCFAINNGEEKVWFSKRDKGTQQAAWISKGVVYEFRLYAGNERKNLLASVKVRRE